MSSIAAWMELSKVSQTEKEKYDIAYMWNLKKVQMNLFIEEKEIYRHRKQTYGYQKRKVGRGTE